MTSVETIQPVEGGGSSCSLHEGYEGGHLSKASLQDQNENEYAAKSLGCISIDSQYRQRLITIVSEGGRFDKFILTVIVFNSITMACVDYRSVDENYEPISTNSWRNRSIEIAETGFMVIFCFECFVKIIAFGLFRGKKAYLRSTWNTFDFTIVILSMVSVVPIFPNLSALRSFRVLRPLRSVSKLPGLRKIIGALVESAGDLSNVMLLLTFLIVCFSITGMVFWKGLLHARCRLTPFPITLSNDCVNVGDICWDGYIENATLRPTEYRCLNEPNDNEGWTQSTSPWFLEGPQDCIWPIDSEDERVCTLNGAGDHKCAPIFRDDGGVINRTCGSNYDAFGNPRFYDTNQPYGYPRMQSGGFVEALNWGFTNFDSFFPAFFTSFQVITLEGWTDIMYQIINVWPFMPTVAIFCIQVVLCGYIVLNLVLAVITKSLDEMDGDREANVKGDGKEDNAKEVRRNIEREASTRFLAQFIGGPKHSAFIMTCIVLNTIVLSVDHYGISENMAGFMEILNTVFTVIFIIDIALCNISYGIKRYWSDPFMFFDGFIGIISLVELIVINTMSTASAGSSSFSVFRSLRLFRIFKMAKNWKSLQSLLSTMISSVKEIGNFTALLILFMFIYSLVGMQILSNRLRFSHENGSVIGISDENFETAYVPRPHFDNFLWSMVTVFQILSGENWNSIMYDCWRARGWLAVVFIISLIVIGVFIVMNLFLAILLKNFEDSGNLVDQSRLDQVLTAIPEQEESNSGTTPKRESYIQIFFAKIGKNNVVRRYCFRAVENPKFDSVVTFLILASSICLAIDNPLADPNSSYIAVLKTVDIIFTSLFIGEMLVKILAYGFLLEKNAYLKSSWNILDFIVVAVSVLNLANIGPGNALRALRTLRVLRPLRMVNRLPELKVVVDALLLSFPSVADVGVLCALFFLIFASFGVNFLKGTFYHCSGEAFESLSSEQVEYLTYPHEWGQLSSDQQAWFDADVDGCNVSSWVHSTIPTSKDVCDCLVSNQWQLVIPQNFDNVISGMSLLLEISTTEGWTDVMYAAIDQRGIEMQPVQNSSPLWAIFFITFLIVGAFFVLELFVGVTIDNFDKIRAKTGRGLMTEAQRNWARTQAFVLKIRPMRCMNRPSNAIRAWCYDTVMYNVNPSFENFITLCIIISSAIAASTSFGDSENKLRIIECINLAFATIFTIEVVLKLVALKMRYFDENWNRFDFSVVCSTNVGLCVEALGLSTGPVIGVIRIARICRLFRLVKSIKKLRMLFNTLIVSIPSIGNIGTLLLLLYFVYAVVGMQLYSFIPNNGDLNDQANFRSFGTAMLLLLRFSTGENWNGFMRSIIPDEKGCDPNPVYNPDQPWCLTDGDYPNCTPLNGCGAGVSAFMYFFTFTLLVSFVILNLFVGIVLEAFETSEEGDILSPDDLDDFTKSWSHFDPSATCYIKAGDMKRLLMELKPPLGMGRRDFREADEFLDDPCLKNLPVDDDGMVDILHAATSLAKRLAVQKQGLDFHDLEDNHPLQQRFKTDSSNCTKTLNDVYLERSKKKLRILRALTRTKIKPGDSS